MKPFQKYVHGHGSNGSRSKVTGVKVKGYIVKARQRQMGSIQRQLAFLMTSNLHVQSMVEVAPVPFVTWYCGQGMHNLDFPSWLYVFTGHWHCSIPTLSGPRSKKKEYSFTFFLILERVRDGIKSYGKFAIFTRLKIDLETAPSAYL